MVWKKEDPYIPEASKIRWETVPYTRGLGYDIGCGSEKVWPHAIGIDNRNDVAMFGIPCNPDLTVPDACDLSRVTPSAQADWVFSSHLLEHIVDYKKALREWWRILKDGGYLTLYLPHKELYPNIGQPGANPDHKHDFVPSDVIEAMKEVGGWDLVEKQERNQDNEYSFYLVFKKFSEKKMHRFSCDEPKPEKTCAIIRYGAWGDVIQMTSILPALKEEGYHITLYSTPRAFEAVEHEPLVDKVILQDHEQVPNAWLGPFWAYTEKKYNRFINLSESVEGSLLAMPDRVESLYWTKEARHAHMNQNYVEFTHKIAGISYDRSRMRFYATLEEVKWAKEQAKNSAGAPLIMWGLAGSSVHKAWPHVDLVMQQILKVFPNARVVTVGDERCKNLIEPTWEKEPRIIKKSGVWSIRDTMAFARECNLVIGPETGVMSAVAMEPMPKIVFLSHSSHENLTRDWVNTHALFSTRTPCYPCHKMIYTWEQCNKDEATGTAHCMAHLPPDAVWKTILEALDVKLEVSANG